MKRNPAERKQTILIVEDDQNVLDVLAEGLSREGYMTRSAKSGSEAVHLSTKMRPDLVVLDLNLPDCNGIQVLDKLKERDETLQVIIITGFGSQNAARRAMEIGAFDFLTKPFEFHELSAVVREALVSLPPVVRREA